MIESENFHSLMRLVNYSIAELTFFCIKEAQKLDLSYFSFRHRTQRQETTN